MFSCRLYLLLSKCLLGHQFALCTQVVSKWGVAEAGWVVGLVKGIVTVPTKLGFIRE